VVPPLQNQIDIILGQYPCIRSTIPVHRNDLIDVHQLQQYLHFENQFLAGVLLTLKPPKSQSRLCRPDCDIDGFLLQGMPVLM
jgi:hypothetical protein